MDGRGRCAVVGQLAPAHAHVQRHVVVELCGGVEGQRGRLAVQGHGWRCRGCAPSG